MNAQKEGLCKFDRCFDVCFHKTEKLGTCFFIDKKINKLANIQVPENIQR